MGNVLAPKPSYFQRAKDFLGFGTIIDPAVPAVKKPTDPITATISTVYQPGFKKYSQESMIKADWQHRCFLDDLSQRNGPAAVTIAAHNHALWTNGWRIESDNAILADAITSRIQAMHAENTLKVMTADGLKYGYGIGEKAKTRDPKNPRVALVARNARQFDILIEEHGIIQGIRQYDLTGKPYKDLGVDDSIILMPTITSEGGGRSILDPAIDSFQWYAELGQACADAIKRHGNTIFNVQLSGPDGRMAPLNAMTGMEGVFTDLNSKAELITSVNTQIKELNQAGVPHVQVYNEWLLQRICADTGMPEELFGLGAGKTGLLAATKWAIFYDKLQSMQHTLEPQIDDQLIDVLAKEEGGKAGEAHFLFTNPNSQNDMDKVAFITALLAANPLNPLVQNDWCLDYLGIKLPGTPTPTNGGEDPGLTG